MRLFLKYLLLVQHIYTERSCIIPLFWQCGKGTDFSYGPWADRQREHLFKFFFPNDYQNMKVTKPLKPGEKRQVQSFDIRLSTLNEATIDILFSKNKVRCIFLFGILLCLSVIIMNDLHFMFSQIVNNIFSLTSGNQCSSHKYWARFLSRSDHSMDSATRWLHHKSQWAASSFRGVYQLTISKLS